jgi:hypothetical protein
MKRPADLAAQLLRKASNDLTAAGIGLDHDAPLDTTCFHVQQAAEKLLKAALAAKDLDYPFTHELRELIELALPHYPVLEGFAATVPDERRNDLTGGQAAKPRVVKGHRLNDDRDLRLGQNLHLVGRLRRQRFAMFNDAVDDHVYDVLDVAQASARVYPHVAAPAETRAGQ